VKGKARRMPNVEKLSEKLSMTSETFVSAKTPYKITIYPAPSDGKKYPVILLVHGNFGLGRSSLRFFLYLLIIVERVALCGALCTHVYGSSWC
jgi:hypothetical protein